jgi:hypothetical protein
MYLLICFNVIHIIKVREHHDNNVNDNETSFKKTLYILVCFCVEMMLQMVENFNIQTEQV